MGKIRRIGKGLDKKRILVIFVLVLLGSLFSKTVLVHAADESDKRQIVRQVAQDWVNAGTEQYKRGFYEQAEKSFLFALDYKEYLSAAEREELTDLLSQTRVALHEREPVLGTIQKADSLIREGQLSKARELLEKVIESPYLTSSERKQVSEALRQLGGQMEMEKEDITELYNKSVELYRTGQFEKAREGFLKIAGSGLSGAPAGMTAEDYLVKIDTVTRTELLESTKAQPVISLPGLSDKVEKEKIVFDKTLSRMARPERINKYQIPEYTKPAPLDVQTEGIGNENYIEVVTRKRNIIQSHTKAVVSDAVANTRDFVSQGKYVEAKNAVEIAERKVGENQLHLGDELYEQYSKMLTELKELINQGQSRFTLELAEEKRQKAAETQKILKEQMETDKAMRIDELMTNSKDYIKQQRYEEALGQLESLLAIDPLNDRALIQKQMLEDTIGYRKQLEVERETSRERVDVLLDAEKAGIPYAEEMKHPKNWREIISRPTRRVEGVLGTDPANMAVMEQMDEVIELLELTPETTFGETIEILKNSVDPPLRVFVNWRDLYEVAEIDQTTPINMDAIPAIPLRTAMELLLDAVSSEFAELGFIVRDGIVTIATKDSLPSTMEIEVYDVTQLVSAPAAFFFEMEVGETSGGGSGGGSSGGGGGRGGGGGSGDESIGTELVEERMDDIILLIQESVDFESWYENGGEATIRQYANNKLVIKQIPENHRHIRKVLKGLGKSFTQQVSIEARFLTVTENFLEDIGLDFNFSYDTGNEWGLIKFNQGSSDAVRPVIGTGVPGGLTTTSGVSSPQIIQDAISFNLAGPILDDLQVSFLVRATQAHAESKTLNAPKVTVISGDSAAIRVETEKSYIADYDFEDITAAGEGQAIRVIADPAVDTILDGVVLNVTPIVSDDKKYVLLRILTSFTQSTFDSFPIPAGQGELTFPIQLPVSEVAEIRTKVNVPDGGTLLIGGQKLTGTREMEVGVPVLSKIPILGRLFENRSEVKDHKILLILVKPTILLQEEQEAKALGDFGSDSY